MRIIHKHALNMHGQLCLRSSISKVLMVGVDANCTPSIWIEIDQGLLLTDHYFFVYGTGAVVPDFQRHVGSFKEKDFIWHVYAYGALAND